MGWVRNDTARIVPSTTALLRRERQQSHPERNRGGLLGALTRGTRGSWSEGAARLLGQADGWSHAAMVAATARAEALLRAAR
jgi:hypothetical protein